MTEPREIKELIVERDALREALVRIANPISGGKIISNKPLPYEIARAVLAKTEPPGQAEGTKPGS